MVTLKSLQVLNKYNNTYYLNACGDLGETVTYIALFDHPSNLRGEKSSQVRKEDA